MGFKIWFWLILSGFFAFSLANLSLALSVTPSVQDIDYAPGESITLQLTFSDVEHAQVALSGALSPYSQLLTPTTYDGCFDQQCQIDIKVTIPDLSNNPGRNDLTVEVAETNPNPDPFSGAGVTALPKVLGIVRMMVPYPGKYLTAKFKPVAVSGKVGEKFPIVVEVTNYGGLTIEQITGTVKVYPFKAGEEYHATLSTLSNLGSKNSGDLKVLWDTTGVKLGRYGIIANISYDDGQTTSAKFPGIDLGDKIVKVIEINPKELYAGKVQKVSFTIENFWNEPFDVYVNAVLKEKETQAILAEAKTPSLKLEKGVGTAESYLDLTKVNVGEYILETETVFSEQSYKESHNISIVLSESVSNDVAGKIPPEPEEKEGSLWRTILIGVIILGLIIFIILFFKKRASREDDHF